MLGLTVVVWISTGSQIFAQGQNLQTTDSTDVITTAGEFWGLSNTEKQKLHHIRLDILVYYYDPGWQLMWGECDGHSSFLPVRGEPLPVRTGQRVRIEGVVQPSRGILRSEVTVTVLEEEAMPEPLATAGNLSDSARFDGQWTSVEGYVCQQRDVDATHIEYLMLSEGWLVAIRQMISASQNMPDLIDSRVRFNGVYVANVDASKMLQGINYWVPRANDVKVLGEFRDDPRTKLPFTPIGFLDQAKQPWVKVAGEVRTYIPGKSLTLRDETGELTISTPQPARLIPGDRVEVLGQPAGVGVERTLKEPLFHLVRQKSFSQGPEPLEMPKLNLRQVGNIVELPLSEVARGYAVLLRGVITWSDPHADFFYLQDSSGGICVWRDKSLSSPPVGQVVEVKGVTTPGRYSPEVRLREIAVLGPLILPSARSVTLEQALTGAEVGRRIEMRGLLREVTNDGAWTRLDMVTATGEFSAYVTPDVAYKNLERAMVRLTGVCSAEANGQRQMTGLRLWVKDQEDIVVENPPLADPFSATRHPINSLKQYIGASVLEHWVTVTGTVLLQIPGQYFFMQDGETGLIVYSRETAPLPPGQTVQVAGLLGRDGGRLVLRDGKVRPVQGNSAVTQFGLKHLADYSPEADTRLVQLQADLRQSVFQKGAVRMTLQAENMLFEAWMDAPSDWRSPEPGSLLELAGVYVLQFDENHQPIGFKLLVRSPGDIRILQTPSWWTAGRSLSVAAGLGICTLLGVFWVTLLGRRVRRQTLQIRAQLEKEAAMQTELERSSRLDSLGVLAGGIAHDFNNLLTAIMGNLGLMRLEKRVMEVVGEQVREAERATKRASEVTQQLLTFAKGGEPVRSAIELPEVVREAAGFARQGSNVRVEFDFARDLPPANADVGQISRVVHNLVLNAVQAMAEGGLIRLSLAAEQVETGDIPFLAKGRFLHLTVADNGPGIPSDRLPKIFDPYFSTKPKGNGLGLATAHSIVKKHHGNMTVESKESSGTTFHIWLPAAERTRMLSAAPVIASPPRHRARVLFMDDEETVRNLARTVLARSGHEATLVSDGAAAVQAYTEAHASGRSFDVVVLDLTVPGGMGGKDALSELRAIDGDVRAVAASGYSHDPVMSNHRAFGFVGVIPKPYDPETFLSAIDRARVRGVGC